MPISVSSYVAAVGKYYDSAVRLSTKKLQFLTSHLIPPMLALIFSDINTSFVIYYLISSTSGYCRPSSSRSSHTDTHSPLKSIFCPVQKNQLQLERYLGISVLFVLVLLLMLANDVHPNPGPVHKNLKCSLSIININAHQITNKVDIIAYEAHHHDIITVSETWLHKDSKKDSLKIDGFHEPVRKDRNCDGGGVAIYVKNNLPCKHRQDLEIPDLEAVWVETYINNEKLLVGSFYRPPSKPVAYWDLIDTSITQVSAEPLKFIVLGDFNSNFLLNPSPHLLNIINHNSLKQLIDQPTRITEKTSTCLDLIITPSTEIISDSGVLEPICSDHSVPFVKLKLNKPKHISFKRTIYDYSNLDIYKLKRDLNAANLCQIASLPNIDETAQLLSETIMNICCTCMPVKIITIRSRDAAWVNDEIRLLCKNKIKYHKRAKHSNLATDWANYRLIRNKYTDAIRKRKKEYNTHIDEQISTAHNFNDKDWWKLVRSFMSKRGSSSDDIPSLIHNNVIYDTNKDKVSILNDFFINQSAIEGIDDIVPDIPTLPHQIPDLNFNKNYVYSVLCDLDTSKAVGPDLVHNRILKECASILAEPLCIIFNKSLSDCKFPELWKTAHITPIFKKGDSSNCTNYRPISLLSCVGKVLEKLVQKHLSEYLKTHNIITDAQCGFLPYHSTIHQLLTIYDDICSSIDKGITTQAVFFDISKAFDKVWHRGLIKKMEAIGIQGRLLEWFRNYLKDRKQAVVYKGCKSTYMTVTAGVPQGSVLGPTLFLIYINDIVLNIKSTIKLLADDTSIYLALNDPNERAEILNSDLSQIDMWAKTWKVSFNPLKTDLMNFLTKSNMNVVPLHFNNTIIENTSTHKHLGVILQHDCKWNNHINSLISKTRILVSCLKSYKYRLNRRSLETIYKSFILPHFDYADILYDNCPLYLKNKLEEVNLDALRTVIGTVKGTSHETIYLESGFTSLAERRKKHKIIMFFKIVNGLVPNFLKEYLPPLASSINPYHRRRPSERRPPPAKSEIYKQSFFPSTTILWNSLPIEVQTSSSISLLKAFLSSNDPICPPRVYYGDRVVQIIHCRLRIEMSDLNFDLFNRHLIPNKSCRCGFAVESSRHYFLDCPLYNHARASTINKIPPVLRNVSIILGGSNRLDIDTNRLIFSYVHNFIVLSKRF